MQKETIGIVDKIQHFCIHDGDGIRTLVFLKGCDFRCPWCSNPESLSKQIELAKNPNRCDNCGICIKACPQKAIAEDLSLDKSLCDMCGECVHYCPKDAWSFYGTGMMVKEVLAEVEKDRAFYNQSGGGVTISGGECTMQGEFLFELLKACKENSISTAIESNANASSEVYKQLSEYVDLFLLDVKHMDSTIHKKATGFGNDRVLSNIRMLTFEMGKKLSIRYPLIPGFNDSDENVLATVQFASEIAKSGNLYKVNILPYHSLGASKYEILGLNYTMSETKAPSQDNIDRVIKAFEKEGLPVLQGG